MKVKPVREIRRTERGEQRRQALMEAARQVFLEQGYEGASIEEVMRRVGGSKASLYSYFGSKEGLFFDILTAQSEQFMKDLRIPDSADDDLEKTLHAVGKRFLNMILDPDRSKLFRIMLGEAQRFPELAQRFFERGPQRSKRAMAEYLRLQHKAGRLDCPDSEHATAQFFELVKGQPHLRMMLNQPTFPPGMNAERHVAAAVKLFLYGCSRTPHKK